MILPKKSQFRILVTCFLFIGTIFARNTKLHLVFTNDVHGSLQRGPARFINPEFSPNLSGGAGAYNYVKSLRDISETRNESVLLTDAGNIFQGTRLGTSDGGRTMIKWMNWMEYDAFTPGVKDFDQGVDNLVSLSNKANFPFLSANLNGVDNVQPYLVKDMGVYKLGIVGITSKSIFKNTIPGNVSGVSLKDPLSTIQDMVNQLKSKNVDIIIVLAHMGLPYQREEEYEKMLLRIQAGEKIEITNALELAHFVTDVDVIITGGIRKGYDTPWEDPITNTLVVQNYGNLTGIGHLIINIDIESRSISGYDFPTDRGMMTTLFEDDIFADETMLDSIDSWVANVKTDYSKMDYVETISMINTKEPPTCPRPIKSPQNNYDIPILGMDETMDVMTWNMERFPLRGDTTISAVIEIIQDLNIDLIGVQEISEIGKFAEMMESLPDYDYVMSKQSSFFDQAVIYRSKSINVLGSSEPFAFDDYFFAGRPPLLVDLFWRCEDYIIEFTVVNMHLKCCGDGLYRRKQSMKQLHSILKDRVDLGKNNILVIGDWNDEIQDRGIYQSFGVFIDDVNRFRFATELIVDDEEQQSYPSWPSFLDHILIGSGFFKSFESGGEIRSVNLDKWMGSWERYEHLVSDHRPILLSLPLE